MRYFILALCTLLVFAAILAASLWQRYQDSEVSAVEYGALYSLRRMDPVLFREKLLPELEKAMTDGRLTQAKLRAINTRIGSLGPVFLRTSTTLSADEQISDSLREAEKKAKEAGRRIGDSLGKALNEALDSMQRKADELSNDEQLKEMLREAEKKALEAGRNLGDSLGKALNEALDSMQRKAGELSQKITPAPQSPPEPPVEF